MKKKLLGTSALVASLVAIGADYAQAGAQVPSLSIMGNARSQAFAFSNKGPSNLQQTTGSTGFTAASQNPRNARGLGYLFTQRGEMDFVVAGVAANGLEYNYSIVLTGDTAASTAISENRIELKGSWGTFQFGDKTGPADILMNDAANVLGATGGFDGDFSTVIATPSGVMTGDSMVPDTGTNTKAIYYTPRFAGFMLGAAFTPLDKHAGNSGISDKNNNSQMTNQGILEGALNFTHSFEGGFGLSLTAAGIRANKTKPVSGTTFKPEKQQAWQLGTLLSYKGFQLGGGYIDNQKSGTVKGLSGYDGGKGWSAALGYTFGDTKVAVGGQWTKQKNGQTVAAGDPTGKADIYSFTVDHTLAPGLAVYAEYDYLNMRNTQATRNNFDNPAINPGSNGGTNQVVASNKANVGILGMKISF